MQSRIAEIAPFARQEAMPACDLATFARESLALSFDPPTPAFALFGEPDLLAVVHKSVF